MKRKKEKKKKKKRKKKKKKKKKKKRKKKKKKFKERRVHRKRIWTASSALEGWPEGDRTDTLEIRSRLIPEGGGRLGGDREIGSILGKMKI